MSERIKPSIFADYVAPKKENVKPSIFVGYVAPKKERIKSAIFATYTPTKEVIKPLIFATYTPTEIRDTTLKPTPPTISKRETGKANLLPSQIIVERQKAFEGTFKPLMAVTFYTPPNDNFITKYKPETAVSFIAPDKRHYFRSNYQSDLLFFPPELIKFAWSSTKTLTWENTAVKSASGKVRTLTAQISPKITIETKLNHITDAGVKILFDFIRKVDGATKTFLWWDEDANSVENIELLRDAFGYYRLPFHPLDTPYIEYAWYIDDIKVILGDELLPCDRFLFYRGAIIILDANGYEIKTVLPTVKASFKYWWKVHFVDDGQGIERIFYNFNRSKTLKLEVVRRV